MDSSIRVVCSPSYCPLCGRYATHALASSATAKPTFNIEEKVVVILYGLTPKKEEGASWQNLNFNPHRISDVKFTPLPSLHVDCYSRHVVS